MVEIILDDVGRPHAITSTGKGLYKRVAGDQSWITQCDGGSRGQRKGPAVLLALKGQEPRSADASGIWKRQGMASQSMQPC